MCRYIMVRFGAKETAMIVDLNEWWRLATPIFIHAGMFHIIPNVAVQVCVKLSQIAVSQCSSSHYNDILSSCVAASRRVLGADLRTL